MRRPKVMRGLWHNRPRSPDPLLVAAIIAAGGRGARFGASQPKQLVTLGGRPILQHAVDAFVASPAIHHIVVALPAEMTAAPPEYLRTATKPIDIVDGGS